MAEMKNLSNYHYKPVGENVYILTIYFAKIQHKSQMFLNIQQYHSAQDRQNRENYQGRQERRHHSQKCDRS